jgi:hypothetical protein
MIQCGKSEVVIVALGDSAGFTGAAALVIQEKIESTDFKNE